MSKIPKIRLHYPHYINNGITLSLTKDQSHYLLSVMRQKIGDCIALFNEFNGEWLCQIIEVTKKDILVVVQELIRNKASETYSKLILAFAPIKYVNSSFIVQKATELGVGVIQPIITKRTIVRKINKEKMLKVAVEAAEQCGRLSIPLIHECKTVVEVAKDFITNSIHTGGLVLFGAAPNNMIKEQNDSEQVDMLDNCCIMIGPEGGFDCSEIDELQKLNSIKKNFYVRPIRLGNLTLRAETAILASISFYQTILGNWR